MARDGVLVEVNRSALRKRRLARYLTQEQLGKEVGITGLQVSRIETGIQQSTIGTVRKIAQVLGCTIEDILN